MIPRKIGTKLISLVSEEAYELLKNDICVITDYWCNEKGHYIVVKNIRNNAQGTWAYLEKAFKIKPPNYTSVWKLCLTIK